MQLKTWLRKTIEPSLDKRFSSAKVALDNLDNLSQSELKDLNAVELSDRHKFYLYKSADRLEIVIVIELKMTPIVFSKLANNPTASIIFLLVIYSSLFSFFPFLTWIPSNYSFIVFPIIILLILLLVIVFL